MRGARRPKDHGLSGRVSCRPRLPQANSPADAGLFLCLSSGQALDDLQLSGNRSVRVEMYSKVRARLGVVNIWRALPTSTTPPPPGRSPAGRSGPPGASHGGDQHGGALTGQLTQHRHLLGKLGIQRRGGLVTEQYLGAGASAGQWPPAAADHRRVAGTASALCLSPTLSSSCRPRAAARS